MEYRPGSGNESTEQADLLIRNALVVTMDAEASVIEDGAVAVRDNLIVGVGATRDLDASFNASNVINGRRKLVMPGLINTHTHSPMTIYRGFADDLPLRAWLYDYIFPTESAFTSPENVRAGTRLAIAEMLLSGTTTFNDLYYYMDEMAEVVDQVGIRAVLSESLIDFPAPNSPSPTEGVSNIERLLDRWKAHPRLRIGVGVHSPYTVSPHWLKRGKELADHHGLLYNVHLAETRWEFDHIQKKFGHSPAKHLYLTGVLDHNVVAAHGVHLTDEDIRLLADHGAGIAHNPQCNMKLASGVARIPELMKAGVRVGIGTDGVASNNDLDLFDEMRTMAFMHKLNSGDPTVISAREALEMATMGGARLLGLDGEIGSLEQGKKADLIVLDMNQPHAHPVYNIYSLIVYSLRGSDVQHAMVDGQWLLFDRELCSLDLGRLYDKVEGIAHKIREEAMRLGIFNGH